LENNAAEIYYMNLFIPFSNVQHDFHIRWCSCHLAVAKRVQSVDQELVALPEKLSSPPFSVGFVMLSL